MSDPWLCTICGLHFTEPSFGGPGICPTCDTGFTGATLIKAQAREIICLRTALFAAVEKLAQSDCSHCKGTGWRHGVFTGPDCYKFCGCTEQ